MERRRHITQWLSTLLANSYWLFLGNTPIYQGPLKTVCFPGLNCYSCPAAAFACPVGALQNFATTLRMGLPFGHFGAYIIGLLGLTGTLLGRIPCGWLCPFGFLQEWIYRIPTKKLGLPRALRFGPYVFLIFFVLLLPALIVDESGYGSLWFCKYICPAGTLEAGLPLMLLAPDLRQMIGALFFNKIILLVIILGLCVFISRFFCRVVCPLGAIYGLFNKTSFIRLEFHERACVNCKACFKICPTGVSFFNGADSINTHACIRCMKCYSICPSDAVSISIGSMKSKTITQDNTARTTP